MINRERCDCHYDSGDIYYCSVHHAAPSLLRAAKAALLFIPMGQPEYRQLETVIAEAAGHHVEL